ncbi:MAG: hypothetical protein LPK03_04440 [Pontibacter sp.]|nr:hypothetical protein [Pontibacter sp.]
MKAISSLLTLALAALLVAGCTKENDATPSEQLTENGDFYEQNKVKVTIIEGIAGTLTLKEGNCMPMIGTGSSTCKQSPVRRVIKVYPYTTIKEV